MDQDHFSSRQKFELAIEAVVASGLQLIPCVGSLVTTSYFGYKQEKAINRLTRFYQELREELEAIKQRIVPFETQEVDGLVALIDMVNDRVENEHQDKKMQAYKAYMKDLFLHPVNGSNYDKRTAFLEALGDLRILEIDLITYFNNSIGQAIQVSKIKFDGIDQYAIVGAITRLRSLGFIRPDNMNIVISRGDNIFNESYAITDYGIEFVKCISE